MYFKSGPIYGPKPGYRQRDKCEEYDTKLNGSKVNRKYLRTSNDSSSPGGSVQTKPISDYALSQTGPVLQKSCHSPVQTSSDRTDPGLDQTEPSPRPGSSGLVESLRTSIEIREVLNEE